METKARIDGAILKALMELKKQSKRSELTAEELFTLYAGPDEGC
jgi:hypothetical protein